MGDLWTLRTYVPEDESCVVPMWLTGLSRSQDARIHGDKRARELGSDEQLAFWAIHQPIVTALVRAAVVVVACDPARVSYAPGAPSVILGWLCTSRDTVLGCGIKRTIQQAGYGRELAAELLGDRLDRAQQRVMDLPDLEALNLVPAAWHRERGWLSSLRWLSERVIANDALYQATANHVLSPDRERWRPSSRRAA